MLNFRLKYLFCLIFVVGLTLMWGMWYRTDQFTAKRLIWLKDHLPGMNYSEFTKKIPPTIMVLVGNSKSMFLVDRGPWTHKEDLWMGCSVVVQVGVSSNRVEGVSWTADWPAIEAKAAEENWTFYRQVMVTVLAVLAIGGWCGRGYSKDNRR
jgi:hypothetical protein